MANGHACATDYSLALLVNEASLVYERDRDRLADHMRLLQIAVAGVMSAKAGKKFDEAIAALRT